MKPLRTRASSRAMAAAAVMAAVMIMAAGRPAIACPNCGLDVVAEQQGGAGLKEGFTYSIVGLASMPFLIAAGAGSLIVRAYRGRNRDGDTGGPSDRE